jgi:uncharacterized protein (DUF39 family)
MAGNFDELKKLIEQDELEVEGHDAKMTVIDYARARKMQPQLVYHYIRSGRLKQEKCVCGRWVLDVKGAEEFFEALEAKRKAKQSGVNL